MFTKNANTTFNNTVFNYPIIRGMSEQISEQMQRLYAAAKELRDVEGKSAVARLLNVSPQMINNWEKSRPISNDGLLKAQEVIGCDAIWLRDGTGEMRRSATRRNLDLSDVTELVVSYSQSSEKERQLILDFVRDVRAASESSHSGGRRAVVDHQPQ